MPKEGDTGARLSSSGIELVFIWTEDRFTHCLGGALSSVGHPDFETPVFQEVHQQGDLVFASGMSGDRHWSASIEAVEDGFLFDVACRCKTPGAAIGSAYAVRGKPAMHVIGKPIDDAPPPEPSTAGTTIAIPCQPKPVGDSPATHRYRYAIVAEGSHWVRKGG